jgi:hypothetical protein
MVSFATDQITELKPYCKVVKVAEEGDCAYILLEGLILPEGCSPSICDALLCPTPRDNYPSRLFFSEQLQVPYQRNWNGNARILGRNWVAFSWTVNAQNPTLAQLLLHHLSGLTRAQ